MSVQDIFRRMIQGIHDDLPRIKALEEQEKHIRRDWSELSRTMSKAKDDAWILCHAIKESGVAYRSDFPDVFEFCRKARVEVMQEAGDA